MAWYGMEGDEDNVKEKNQRNVGLNKAEDYLSNRETHLKSLKNWNNGKATKLNGRSKGGRGSKEEKPRGKFAGTDKSFYGSSPARPYTPSTNMFTSNKEQHPSSSSARPYMTSTSNIKQKQGSSQAQEPYKVNPSSLRMGNGQGTSNWNVGSGKVEKGQSSEWKHLKDGQGKKNTTKQENLQRRTKIQPVQHLGFGQSEMNYRQMSTNKGNGGDSNIDLTFTPSPPKVLKIQEPHLIGFRNRGNTCYLNASLQALLGLPMMVTDAVNLKYAVDRKGSPEKPVKPDMIDIFLQIAKARENKDFDKVTRNIDLLKTELEQIDKQFIGSKMQDANEFLSRLIDLMKDNIDHLLQELSPDVNEVKALVTEKDDGSKVELPNTINSNFLSEREETFKCMNCHSKESNRHRDLNFYCTVARALGGEDRPVQLQKLTDSTFETNEVRERRCDCGHNTALTTNRLTRLPRVLVIHLKRYDYEQGEESRKISRPVSLPAKLNLTKYVAENAQLPEPVMERLCRREPLIKPHPPPITPSNKRLWVAIDDDIYNVSSPMKVQGVERLSTKQCVTPVKFRGKTASEIDGMGEDDKLEYTLHMSMKSIPETTNNNTEDQNLAAAIHASLNETPSKRDSYKMLSDSPARGAADKVNSKYVSAEKMEAPETQEEEERQIQEALELSMQADTAPSSRYVEFMDATEFPEEKDKSSSFVTAPCSPSEMGESSNNNDLALDYDNGLEGLEGNPGLPEHDYRLVSVISHQGSTTNSGHYVADVYRFDQGSWFQYSDTQVTPTTEDIVRKSGNNTKNGYIFMYLHEELAKQLDKNKTF